MVGFRDGQQAVRHPTRTGGKINPRMKRKSKRICLAFAKLRGAASTTFTILHLIIHIDVQWGLSHEKAEGLGVGPNAAIV